MAQKLPLVRVRARDIHTKFVTSRDHALVIILLSFEPSLLYLIRDPVDSMAVWKSIPKEDMGQQVTNEM